MIFFGDIASPDPETTGTLQEFFKENNKFFGDKRLIFNFEGLISATGLLNKNNSLLFNHLSVPSVLKYDVAPVFCLANNHTLDIPEAFDGTIRIFKDEGILFCGAGKSKNEALEPLYFSENGKQIILFNACWNFLLYSQRNPTKGVYIAEINEMRLISDVRLKKGQQPDAAVVVFLHWSLDQETLPFPLYRQFAKDLIEAGVNVVVGSHSHCIQGGEKYKNGFIVYGLGNFFIPHNVFINGRLKYAEFTKMQMVLEWDPISDLATCHWIEYGFDNACHNLTLKGSEAFETSDTLKKYSPFLGMPEHEYLAYFRKQRRKRFLIPVYRNYKKKYTNYFLTFVLKNRARIAHMMARLNIINWQN